MFAESIVFSVMMFVWVLEDARRRNAHLSALLKSGVVALGGIFIPVYMVRTRGLRSASKSIAIFVLQLLASVIAAAIVLAVLPATGH